MFRCLVVASLVVGLSGVVVAQPRDTYRLIEPWPYLPAEMNGGEWGETIGVDRDADGNIWVFHRCFNDEPFGLATCVGQEDKPPILKFSPKGELLASWGEGIFAAPHGFHIDPEGNIWATEANQHEEVLGIRESARVGI